MEERARLEKQFKEQKSQLKGIIKESEAKLKEQEREHQKKAAHYQKIIEKRNYDMNYPMPQLLKQHKAAHPNAFYIQVLGVRGAGKSSFLNNVLKKLSLKHLATAKTSTEECTKQTAFYPITSKIENKPPQFGEVFLSDQPGIGGLQIKEAGYLEKFGPGHFDFTLLLCEKGFNELDKYFLNHLLHHKKPFLIVRTQCDAAITGIQQQHDESVDDVSHNHRV